MSKPYSDADKLPASDLNADFKFGGTGADGAKNVSADENLDAGNAAYVVKNYTSLIVAATKTWTVINPATAGTVVHIKVTGDVTINGKISLKGCGSAGGAGGAGRTGSGGSGDAGGTGTAVLAWDLLVHEGGGGGGGVYPGGGYGGAGGGGGGHYAIGSVGTTLSSGAAGIAGVALTNFNFWVSQYRRGLFVVCGAGGGGGGGGARNSLNGLDGSAGGNGGGVLILEVCGNITYGVDGEIDVSGNDGGNATAPGNGSLYGGGGAGGGGSGGLIYIIYNGTLTDNGIAYTVSGGTGGAASGANNYDGGAGGNGGAGTSYVVKNTEIS